MDQAVFTPSDFCIMGTGMKFEAHSIEAIKNEVIDFFNDAYDGLGNEIEYVNPAYKIGDFYKVTARYTEL